jgi:hypothetical protein
LVLLGYQLAFGTAYLVAFRHPTPYRVPVAVAGPDPSITRGVAEGLEGHSGESFAVRVAVDAGQARQWVADRVVDGAYGFGPGTNEVMTATAVSPVEAQLITATFRAVHDTVGAGRPLEVTNLAPVPSTDAAALGPFYLALVWVLGGYLAITVVGPALRSRRLVGVGLAVLAGYALVAAVTFSAIAHGLGVGVGHFWALVAVGTLIGFATGTAAGGLEAVLGAVGTILVLLVFIGFGAPASGGPLPYHLLPWVYGLVGPYLPMGAGVDLIRNVVYFHGAALARPLGVLFGWGLAGLLLMVIVTRRPDRIPAQTQAEVAAAGTASL